MAPTSLFSRCCDEIYTIFDLIACAVTHGPGSAISIPFVIIDNVNSDQLYVVRQRMKQMLHASGADALDRQCAHNYINNN